MKNYKKSPLYQFLEILIIGIYVLNVYLDYERLEYQNNSGVLHCQQSQWLEKNHI
jgi:hypothetical protein